MVNPIDLSNAIVDTLRRCPELVSHLDPPEPESIFAYIDMLPDYNSVDSAKYGQPSGSVMVVWDRAQEVAIETGLLKRAHWIEIYLKAARGQSNLQLVADIYNGVPVPGDGLRWYLCPVLPGVERTTLDPAERITDPEQIDLMMVATQTYETGIGDP